ncbi:glycosyltransferase [Liquorilactobacillus satsumensis]|uniref:UDP-D-galactose (Glucosyl)lipopolysaccharide-1,6-D-galactosyltransferase n=1 Tax=Liquorilactobacillus satsumensis DSM 16230 = JCM 12392 TaxID=1423801 RepID=A0A0R1V5X4_9LACO|nr:glycosyltransferase [Liquorilactobacillus satsumensis]KRL98482.1 UDP-D-galactose (glucosyl)lipopolysaccharide-1,6-D-galactosyltransferase [Liquorilactobacillus satsumensis DSM 16230 = JCM 12392]MCC7666036.1 UDP-D-galactose--(glucosyl)lipopolysaccharide-1,6-D-galactosyltransferase [Liquorilactobacillus satsumensis]MCP9313062.1 glycosyltransferase [Liquorilactobacillus satsumensis]MCP9329365.1 glycosyltransferase [Liquorilactobacillus satsumensis]MCP9356859.1 glycosyltransferase [Liquorilacto
MKINFLCFALSGTGGTETVLIKVLNFLCQKNEVVLYLPNEPHEKAWMAALDRRVVVKTLARSGRVSKLLFFLKALTQIHDNDKCVVLGANTIKLAYWLRRALRRHFEIISWIHFSLLNQKMFDPHNLLYADTHWAISTVIKNQLLELGVAPEKIKLVYNPIEHQQVITQDVQAKDTSLNLVYVGRIIFEGQKNIRELLTAVAEYQKNNKVRLDLYGTGADLAACQAYAAQLGISAALKWHGWVKAPWNNLAVVPAAVVLTSKYEGLPMVLLEAAARGIPAVTSRFDGYDDVLVEGVNGYSYETGNLTELVAAFKQLSRNQLEPQTVVSSINKFYSENYFENLESIIGDGRKITNE